MTRKERIAVGEAINLLMGDRFNQGIDILCGLIGWVRESERVIQECGSISLSEIDLEDREFKPPVSSTRPTGEET